MTDTPARSATCARVTRLEPAEYPMMLSLAEAVYPYTHDREVPPRSAHLDRLRAAGLVCLPAGGAGARHRAPARRAPSELLHGRAVRRGVRGREPGRGRELGAAWACAWAAPTVLVGGRPDECGGDRVDGGTHRCGDRRLGAGHGGRGGTVAGD